MRFLKVIGRLQSFASRISSDQLSDSEGLSLIVVTYLNCLSTTTETAHAYVNRAENSLDPIFPDKPGIFSGGQSCQTLIVSHEEIITITVLSSNQLDAQNLCKLTTEFIQTIS